jgi:hypothetical protein
MVGTRRAQAAERVGVLVQLLLETPYPFVLCSSHCQPPAESPRG